MRRIQVALADGTSYPIFVGAGILTRSGELLSQLGFRSAPIVITNARVQRLQGQTLTESLARAFGPSRIICMADGERFKNHSTLLRIYDGLFRARADRKSWIVSLGGGVVGDMAGFAAATFMRGIPYVNVPTTLLAQVDSAVGGKVGINTHYGKNLIGAFCQPRAVISDTDVLSTLPPRELAAGLYEVIKCGAIRSPRLLGYIERRLPAILECRPEPMQHIILEACRIKADVVARDERESDLRVILNYGHTVGHALEAATRYQRFKHGEAVAWGMIAALGFGRTIGLLSDKESGRLTSLIHEVERLPPLKGIAIRAVWHALMRDKKFQSGSIQMVLLPRLGSTTVPEYIDPLALKQYLAQFLATGGDPIGMNRMAEES
jgi:3-dehydroquinate synthase